MKQVQINTVITITIAQCILQKLDLQRWLVLMMIAHWWSVLYLLLYLICNFECLFVCVCLRCWMITNLRKEWSIGGSRGPLTPGSLFCIEIAGMWNFGLICYILRHGGFIYFASSPFHSTGVATNPEHNYTECLKWFVQFHSISCVFIMSYMISVVVWSVTVSGSKWNRRCTFWPRTYDGTFSCGEWQL